ncbi:MAG: metal-dependent transcriptional regulator [Anaerolineales bacterium]|nr:metal-dependent transcriptional regulator [Anaerolineales bacterium]
MNNHKSEDTSESEEMYLLTIARMTEQNANRPVPITQIAEELGLQPVSVHQMIRKLEDSDLVNYLPYKGVLLTNMGETIACTFLRFHRLWEVFLTTHLGFTVEEASEIACELEHASTEELAKRLETYLDGPVFSPKGKLIPPSDPEERHLPTITLSNLKAGKDAIILQIKTDEAARAFLASEGVTPGAIVTSLGTGSTGDILVDVNGNSVHLGEKITHQINIKPVPVPASQIRMEQKLA